jgi:acetylornithine deacetylase/succinyl-diaminopimelate desuccinylase-like protein
VAADALRRAFDTDPVFIRDGGTIPAVAHLDEVLGLRSLLLPFGLPNENKHAPNEWLDLANYRRGMEAIARLWIGLGELHAKRSSS